MNLLLDLYQLGVEILEEEGDMPIDQTQAPIGLLTSQIGGLFTLAIGDILPAGASYNRFGSDRRAVMIHRPQNRPARIAHLAQDASYPVEHRSV